MEAIRGSNAESDVAIDDISIHAGSCTGDFYLQLTTFAHKLLLITLMITVYHSLHLRGFRAMAVESWLPTTPADVPPPPLGECTGNWIFWTTGSTTGGLIEVRR